MTPNEFDTWILLPQNYDHTFEFIAGKPVIKHPTNTYDSIDYKNNKLSLCRMCCMGRQCRATSN